MQETPSGSTQCSEAGVLGEGSSADSGGGAAELSVGAERKHRRSPKTHPGEDNSFPRSDAGGEGLFSLAQDSMHRRPVMLQLCSAQKAPGDW